MSQDGKQRSPAHALDQQQPLPNVMKTRPIPQILINTESLPNIDFRNLKLPIIYSCSLFIVHCSLFIVHCSLFINPSPAPYSFPNIAYCSLILDF